MVKKKSEQVTIEQVKELIDTNKPTKTVSFFVLIMRSLIVLILWQSSVKIYNLGINESTLAGVGIGASTIIILWAFANFITEKVTKYLNNLKNDN